MEYQRNALQERLRLYECAIGNMAEGFCMFDADARLVICNNRYIEIYDLPPELVMPGTHHARITEYRLAHGLKMVGTLQSFMEQHQSVTSRAATGVTVVQTQSGAMISIHHRNLPEGGWVATHWDVTDDLSRVVALEERESDLKLQNVRFDAALNNMAHSLCMFDREKRLVVCNDHYATLFGVPSWLTEPGAELGEILAHRRAAGIVPSGDSQRYLDPDQATFGEGELAKEEFKINNGRIISAIWRKMADGGWVATYEDITTQRQQQDRIRYLARHDPLTDLPNRAHFSEELDNIDACIARGERWTLLYFDLDYFKTVNDTLGHGVGDAVLTEVAARLKANCRDQDIVARLGGDEFALLVRSLDRPDDCAAVAQRIIDAMEQPILVDGHEVSIGVSIGIAVAPDDGSNAETLMHNADLALYRAKAEGRGNFQYFEAGMNAALQERRFMETGVRAALALKQFQLVYQPLIRLEDNSISSFEALLRWNHPARGLIPPDHFIPIAEEIGVMVPIGQWVLREACRTASKWPAGIRVSVNLSPAQFKARDLVSQVISALAESGLPGNRLELEITESLLLAETELTLQTLHKLRDLGVRVSMDDFGTGYSSLSYLRSFPFDKIKIDRSFVADLASHADNQAIVGAVISLGDSLGMATTVEGVETDEELSIIRAHGCQEVQGFLFSPPVSAIGATQLIAKFAKEIGVQRSEEKPGQREPELHRHATRAKSR
jgi:diguanylate cyclase (GGDEF)-like protein